ncbi:MAG: type II toxin-antitoxin system RelE/ParE family toxin [Rhizobiaceae bacterium]
MPRLIWTATALRDVSRLHRFLRSKSPSAARRAVATIRDGVKTLGKFPESGRPVEELPEGYREKLVPFGGGAYVVLYRLNSSSDVVILAIRHGRESGYQSI